MQVFGADDLEWTGNVSSRLLRLGWLFFILITISSYTANLASFFTAVNFEIVGPQDMTALQSATVCLPDHANDEAHLERTQTKYGVGSVLGGLVTAFMPPDFAGKSDEEKRSWHSGGQRVRQGGAVVGEEGGGRGRSGRREGARPGHGMRAIALRRARPPARGVRTRRSRTEASADIHE